LIFHCAQLSHPPIHWHTETCHEPGRGPSNSPHLSSREWPRPPFTARIERARFYCALCEQEGRSGYSPLPNAYRQQLREHHEQETFSWNIGEIRNSISTETLPTNHDKKWYQRLRTNYAGRLWVEQQRRGRDLKGQAPLLPQGIKISHPRTHYLYHCRIRCRPSGHNLISEPVLRPAG